MIIVSQDKDKLINFNNVTQIYITNSEDNEWYIRYESVDSLYEDLGEYKTEERSKEILQEIIKTYKTTEGYKCSNDLDFHKALIENSEKDSRDVFIYVMPSK